ncbi:hypothetical protein KYT87_18180 [Achromobacter sp. ES-001]|nr:hypothetical protein [Achromobacter sp. ES-001]QYJ19639.1 hypothetical protein KYT87_18180 [Achromobacter sp. ES-001]
MDPTQDVDPTQNVDPTQDVDPATDCSPIGNGYVDLARHGDGSSRR